MTRGRWVGTLAQRGGGDVNVKGVLVVSKNFKKVRFENCGLKIFFV